MGCAKQLDKSDSLNTELEKTFADSKSVMSDFVNKWSEDSDELSNDNPTDLETNFSAIYNEVFSPFSYQIFGWDEWADTTPFTRAKYIVIQSEIPYKIVSKVDTVESAYHFSDTLRNFFPRVSFDQVKTLYLSNDYQNTFTKFLGNPTNETEREIFSEKKNFLNNTLTLSYGYSWRVILTHPIIDGIYISTDFMEATVDLTILQSGLRSYLVKGDGKWTIKSTKTTWID